MLEDASIRPYFIRAVYQWCVDKGYTPYLLVNWNDDNPSPVPKRLVSDGKIVFNISVQAVRHFVIDVDGIFFTARFFGKTIEVQIPLAEVVSVYAREKQSGISFSPLPPAKEDKPLANKAPLVRRRRKKMTTADIEII